MSNIPQHQLNKTADQTTNLLKEIDGSIAWVEQYLKAEERNNASYELKKIRRGLKKIRYAITQKPAAALYGESQVGKSYLIKNLLSVPGTELRINDISSYSNESHDFLEDINPKGDQTEATSVVTRFTVSKDHIINNNYPIKINLLSPKDVILFLCDSYFSDLIDHAPRKVQEYDEDTAILVKAYSKLDNEQSYLSEDDVYEIKEYLEGNFLSNVGNLKDATYWDTVASLIHRVSPSDWYKVFEIIWGKKEPINEIFNRLVKELEKLGFVSEVYAEFKSILRKYGTILHVARLKEIVSGPSYEDVQRENYDPRVKIVYVKNTREIQTEMEKSLLCALSGELIIGINDTLTAEKKFLEHSDLLDFPGARSRLETKESNLRNDVIDVMVLRGKVSYIFNKYSADRLISNLLFCNKDAKIEVKYIPRLLNNWIETYIGEDRIKRSESLKRTPLPPLFVIFTFFNNDLKFNEKNDREETLREKWMKRFVTIFENEIVTKDYNWHKDWTQESLYFKNFYLLRDFTHSKEFFEGYSKDKKEKGFTPVHYGDKFEDSVDYFAKLKKSFLDFEFVKNHFRDPEVSWTESAGENKDGSKLIIDSLTSVSDNETRTYRFVNLLNELKTEALNIIEKHFHSDESDEQIKKAARIGAEIHANMNNVFGKNPYHFGRFIKNFMLTEGSIYNYYHEKLTTLDLITKTNITRYIHFRESSPKLSNKNNYEENLDVLKIDYHLNDHQEVESKFKEMDIDLNELFYGELNALKNNSLALAEGLRDFWFDNKLDIKRFKPFIDDGFSASALEKLLENIKINFNRQKIIHHIAEKIRQFVDRYDKINQAEEMIADISAGIINEFVNSLGWSFYTNNEREKIKSTSDVNKLNLVLPHHEVVFESMEEEHLSKLFEDMDKLNENLSQVPVNEEAIKNVPMIRHYRRWRDLMKVSFVANCDIPTYDVEGNRRLKIILERIKIYNFTIN
jgi:hypothetical protein